MDIPMILDAIRPGAAWGWLGEDKGEYANLDWRDEVQEKPSWEEVEAAWPAVEAALAKLAQDDADRERARLGATKANVRAILAVLQNDATLAPATRQALVALARLVGQVAWAAGTKPAADVEAV